jgi:hypothetical protein
MVATIWYLAMVSGPSCLQGWLERRCTPSLRDSHLPEEAI